MTVGAERSRVMRAVKGKNTGPEMKIRRMLHGGGYRYRLHRADLPGAPDIVFPGRRKVIFVHGCFWHGHKCKRGDREPKTNRAYWRSKIARNRDRDERHRERLTGLGWRTMVVWECEIANAEAIMERMRRFLDGS